MAINSERVIGGTYQNPGCKYDNFEILINDYFSLLFDALTNDGITYSTGRNGLLAKVELDSQKGGFINYVQSSIGKWDYHNPKYQRKVSPEFVLYLFNRLNMIETYSKVNDRNKYYNEPMKFNGSNQSVDGVFLRDLSMSGIISLFEQHRMEQSKKMNGEPNRYDQIKTVEITMVKSLYELVGSVCKYSKKFWNFHIQLEKAEELRKKVNSGNLSYESLTPEEDDLYDNFYEDEDYYLSLGFFNNSIRQEVAQELLKRCQQKKICEKQGKRFSDIYQYDDPVSIKNYDDNPDMEYYGESDYVVAIDYENASEFPLNKSKLIHINEHRISSIKH